jgi:hypothetical protein
MTQNAQTGVSYSFVLTDFTKLVTTSNAGAVAVTLPLESSVAWPSGTQLRILNIGAGTVTVAGAAGVTINGTPLTLAQFKAATIVKTGTNTWSFLPFSSGVGAANFSDTATGTYSSYKYLTFTASGTITVTTAGFADILLVGGGAGGGSCGGGGGGGGSIEITNAYLPTGTLTVTIAAGGAGGTNSPYIREKGSMGGTSKLLPYSIAGGGGGGGNRQSAADSTGQAGANGGGGALANTVATGGTGFQGSNGGAGDGASIASGGGGGTNAVGTAGTVGPVGGNGGAGLTSSLDNTSTVYGSGGGGGTVGGTAGTGGTNAGNGTNNDTTPTAATANRGGGGGGSGLTTTAAVGGNGGSGLVIVRVAV